MNESFVDYYNLLDVDRNASQIEIKKAYRSLAKTYHPDQATGNEEHFLLIKRAFDTLYDPVARKIYDQQFHHYESIHYKEERSESSVVVKRQYTERRLTKSMNRKMFVITVGLFCILLALSKIQIKDKNPSSDAPYMELKYNSLNTTSSYSTPDVEKSDIDLEVEAETDKVSLVYKEEINDNLPDIEVGNYFTLESSEEEVKNVMGIPSSILYDTWSYELSSIYFENGKVTGWSNLSNNLKVKLGEAIEGQTFTIGSTLKDVSQAMGTPDSILYDSWGYDLSSIYFQDGLVSGWSNLSGNLNVYMQYPEPEQYFSIGSSKEAVLKAMGTPDSILYDTWSYQLSSIYFDSSGNVSGYSDLSGILKVN